VYFIVSISNEVFHRTMSMRALSRRLGIEASMTRDSAELLRDVRESFGGRLVLLDWEDGRAIADLPLVGASGLDIRDGLVHACSWIDQSVHVLRGREEVAKLTHRWFNYLHSIEVTPAGTYLLASAGSDLIAELAADGQVPWSWFGSEHGFGTLPAGGPAFFDREADYRAMRRGTSEQAMHVTSALFMPDGSVLATLFHQGQLIQIERPSGRATVRADGFSRPHGVHRSDGGFLLSDTLGHRIVFLDDHLKVVSEIPCGSQWLQDAIPTTRSTFLTLENVHIDQLPEPGLTNRLAEVDLLGRRLRGIDVDVDHRLFTAREVDEELAGILASAWGSSGEFDGWRPSRRP
jgi:hypothetical protein